MDSTSFPTEREAAILQGAITVGLALLFALLYRRYRRQHFLWWSLAWLLYSVRVGFILTFLFTTSRVWLYLHQVATGWTALAILAAAFSFERRRIRRPFYAVGALLPVALAYVTIYVLDNFLLAAILTVLLLSASTMWTGLVFLRFRQRTGSASAAFVAGTLLLWSAHHLDYPLLRARGLLAPWSYYIDILLILALAVGVLLLVMEELKRGLRTLGHLSGDLQRARAPDGVTTKLLDRALGLAGITGSALVDEEGLVTHALGTCSDWRGATLDGGLAAAARTALGSERPTLLAGSTFRIRDRDERIPFVGFVPVMREGTAHGAVMIIGPARAPFAVLDEEFLLALGQQIGAALESVDLDRRLKARTNELEHLSIRLIRQHEEQRRRLARELHDETAQVFSAMTLQLGLLGEATPRPTRDHIDSLRSLVDAGMKSIRSVADDLRPQVLDDLGLTSALQALVRDFGDRSAIASSFSVAGDVPALADESELVVFRTMQEALANVARHAAASAVQVELVGSPDCFTVVISDNGRGFAVDQPRSGHMGLVGMQERVLAVGGTLRIESSEATGTRIDLSIPVAQSGGIR